MKPRVNCPLQLAFNFTASLELLSLVLIQVVVSHHPISSSKYYNNINFSCFIVHTDFVL